MSTGDLHSALKASVLADVTEGGIRYFCVRLQHSKDVFVDTLHAHPDSHSTSGIQTTDFLSFLGFTRAPCAFHRGECFCCEVSPNQNVASLSKAIAAAFHKFQAGASALEHCGLRIDQPEGWGFYFGKPSSGRRFGPDFSDGNGHVAPTSERMKVSEDTYFKFVLTWVDGAGDKGWTTHYRAKHMPLSPEFQAALDFLGGFSWFKDCPEFDFEGCWWRFTEFRDDERDAFNRHTEYVHQCFVAHANYFSVGLEHLLAAHSDLTPYGMSFLDIRNPAIPVATHSKAEPTQANATLKLPSARSFLFDVAISFAGTERPYAEELARRIRDAGFEVFYDGFYPEQLWGKDLASHFDSIYRKDSRFCVMFVSREYAERMWTIHERRSAQARAIEEKGREYILPIRADDTDLDGLPPTVGHVSLKEYSVEKIAELLVKKLK